MRALWLIPALLALVAVAQAGTLPEKEMAAARKLNLTKCAKCHELHSPARYSERAWSDWLARMNRKAKLKPEQADLLLRYFDLQRAEARASATNALARR